MNPKTKIYYQGRRINGRFDTFKAKVRRAGILAARTVIIGTLAYAVFVLGASVYSTDNITIANAEVKVVEAPAPILDRIAMCESHGHQLNPNGQVLLNVNTNGTVDIGRFQINSIHEAEATKLGYDLFTLEGNTAYAKWLYANKGTGDWSSSAKCWAR